MGIIENINNNNINNKELNVIVSLSEEQQLSVDNPASEELKFQ